MGFLITEEQRKALSDGGIAAVPTTIMAILSSNHARVLDWFREMDTNFDGVISQGEMSYALGALGLNVSPKEVAGVFAVLDPDGDGVIEFDELRRALTNPEKWSGKGPVQKKLTATQRARAKTESEVAKAEMIECIHAFECSRGLQDPAAARPPTAKEALDAARRERAMVAAIEARKGNGPGIPVSGPLMARLDQIWVKQPLLRPQSAPARVRNAASAARRKAATYDFWLNKHRAEIEAHTQAVELANMAEKRMRKERAASQRSAQLAFYRGKAAASKAGALERQEPFPNRREHMRNQSAVINMQRTRAWRQELVFLPPSVASREVAVQRDRMQPDFEDGVTQVYALR